LHQSIYATIDTALLLGRLRLRLNFEQLSIHLRCAGPVACIFAKMGISNRAFPVYDVGCRVVHRRSGIPLAVVVQRKQLPACIRNQGKPYFKLIPGPAGVLNIINGYRHNGRAAFFDRFAMVFQLN